MVTGMQPAFCAVHTRKYSGRGHSALLPSSCLRILRSSLCCSFSVTGSRSDSRNRRVPFSFPTKSLFFSSSKLHILHLDVMQMNHHDRGYYLG